MAPRADREHAVAAGGDQPLVVGDLPRQEDVVPAAHQARGGRLRGVPLEVDRIPPRVPGRVVGQPLLEELDMVADRSSVGLGQRQHGVRGPQLTPDAGHGPQDGQPAELLVLDRVDPGEGGLQREPVAREDDRVADAAGGDRGRHGPEVVRRIPGDRPLREAEVARAERPRRAAEPRLLGQPAEGGHPVVLLVAERHPLATGSERAAAALDHDLVAAFGDQAADHPQLPAAVRRSQQHHRQPGPGGGRVPAIGPQDHPVGHLRLEVPIDRDVVALRPGDRASVPSARLRTVTSGLY